MKYDHFPLFLISSFEVSMIEGIGARAGHLVKLLGYGITRDLVFNLTSKLDKCVQCFGTTKVNVDFDGGGKCCTLLIECSKCLYQLHVTQMEAWMHSIDGSGESKKLFDLSKHLSTSATITLPTEVSSMESSLVHHPQFDSIEITLPEVSTYTVSSRKYTIEDVTIEWSAKAISAEKSIKVRMRSKRREKKSVSLSITNTDVKFRAPREKLRCKKTIAHKETATVGSTVTVPRRSRKEMEIVQPKLPSLVVRRSVSGELVIVKETKNKEDMTKESIFTPMHPVENLKINEDLSTKSTDLDGYQLESSSPIVDTVENVLTSRDEMESTDDKDYRLESTVPIVDTVEKADIGRDSIEKSTEEERKIMESESDDGLEQQMELCSVSGRDPYLNLNEDGIRRELDEQFDINQYLSRSELGEKIMGKGEGERHEDDEYLEDEEEVEEDNNENIREMEESKDKKESVEVIVNPFLKAFTTNFSSIPIPIPNPIPSTPPIHERVSYVPSTTSHPPLSSLPCDSSLNHYDTGDRSEHNPRPLDFPTKPTCKDGDFIYRGPLAGVSTRIVNGQKKEWIHFWESPPPHIYRSLIRDIFSLVKEHHLRILEGVRMWERERIRERETSGSNSSVVDQSSSRNRSLSVEKRNSIGESTVPHREPSHHSAHIHTLSKEEEEAERKRKRIEGIAREWHIQEKKFQEEEKRQERRIREEAIRGNIERIRQFGGYIDYESDLITLTYDRKTGKDRIFFKDISLIKDSRKRNKEFQQYYKLKFENTPLEAAKLWENEYRETENTMKKLGKELRLQKEVLSLVHRHDLSAEEATGIVYGENRYDNDKRENKEERRGSSRERERKEDRRKERERRRLEERRIKEQEEKLKNREEIEKCLNYVEGLDDVSSSSSSSKIVDEKEEKHKKSAKMSSSVSVGTDKVKKKCKTITRLSTRRKVEEGRKEEG